MKKLKHLAKRGKELGSLKPKSQEVVSEENLPRITNETVASHREEVLRGARKFIYPLQHSRHRIVLITSALVVSALVGLLIYSILALYRFGHDNTFLYRVTQIVPFPVARSGGTFIEYENYLFELRHYKHYYENQLDSNLESEQYKQQLVQYRKVALDQVINHAFVKELAKKNNVTVTDREVSERIELLRNQNRLGSGEEVLEDVLRDYWGWSLRDFERELRSEILAEKVASKLDTATVKKASDTLAQIRAGSDFAELAKTVSDDPAAKTTGGEYGFLIDQGNRNIPPQVARVLFSLKPTEVSEVINTGITLEIVRLNEKTDDKVKASHIVFNLKNAVEFVNAMPERQKVKSFIK